MYLKRILLAGLLLAFLSACSTQAPNATQIQNSTATPLSLPATWTPTATSLPQPTATTFPTFTAVPAFTAPVSPIPQPLDALAQESQRALYSPDGQWSATYDSETLKVTNQNTGKVWTLPCALFQECSFITPVKWTSDSQVLYFAPEAFVFEAPIGVSLYTAVAQIDIESGEWEKVLPETDRYYDFAVSSADVYLAYSQPEGSFSENNSILLTVINLKTKQEQKYALDGFVGGNIVWSPFKPRLVFQIQDPAAGSSILYYDVEADILRYIIKNEQNYFRIAAWREDNLIAVRKITWFDRIVSDWTLNPFTSEWLPAPTSIP